jgi:hypothetical protein
MFLAFNKLFSEGTDAKFLPVYYYCWDAGQFEAARPTAQKMKKQFNERFTIMTNSNYDYCMILS